MASFKINPPEALDFSRPDAWPQWKQRYERYRLCSKLNTEEGLIQVSNLIYVMGGDAEKIYASFAYENVNPPLINPENNYDIVIQKFDEHFVPRRNTMHERSKFYLRYQEEGETIEHFVRALYELAEYADFRDQRDENIRDRLVLGIRDKDLTRKLQLETDLTLKRAIDIARHYELVTTQVNEQCETINRIKLNSTENASPHKVDYVRERKGPKRTDFDNNSWYDARRRPPRNDMINCGNCFSDHERGRCPANGKECNYCHKFNHFARACRAKRSQTFNRNSQMQNPRGNIPRNVHSVEEEDHQEFYIPSLTSEPESSKLSDNHNVCSIQNEPPWTVLLELNNHNKVAFKIDTGADVSVLSSKTFDNMNPKPELQHSNSTLRSPGGIAKCLGKFSSKVKLEDNQFVVEFYVIDGPTDNLLSRDASLKMNLVKRINMCAFPETINTEIFGPLTKDPVKSRPVKICLNDDYQPYSLNTARRVPIPLMNKVKNELERLKENNIIQEINEPTDWCAGMVPAQKKNGGIRICADFKKLNKSVKRERYQIPTIEDVLHKLKDATVFSKLDATSGFHQLQLDTESAKLTTFITPFGRFFYRRLPFGISSAPEIFQKTMETILEGQEHVFCYYDDVLVFSKNENDHKQHLKQTIDTLHAANVKLNKEKCEFFKKEIEFLGCILSAEGSRPDPSKVKAICDMPPPKNVDEVRRFLGMVNFLGRYLQCLSSTLHPITELLEKDKAWTWGPPQSLAFEQTKKLLSEAPTLAYYDPTKQTIVSSDSSSYGIAGVLLQVDENGTNRPVAYCSRTLTETEKRYAQIEKELLASVWSCERFHRYLMGLESFEIETDHKPLIPLLNTKDLSETPLRCQRMLMRMLRFNVTARFTPGKNLSVADHLSRSPIPNCEKYDLEDQIEFHVNEITRTWPISDTRLEQIREATQNDINLRYAFEYTVSGWPAYKEDVKLAAREFYGVKGELSVVDGLLVRDSRIIIPYNMRKTILDAIHEGHRGLTKCRQFANQCVWWPGISRDLNDKIASCRYCIEKLPANKREPMIPSELPDRPFQKVGVDIGDVKGEHYLIFIDYYTRWIEIQPLLQMTSKSVINKLKLIFATHGIPELLVSDNGAQFSSAEFKRFSQEWSFRHSTSSPAYAQSNGEAERAVRTAKDILKQDKPIAALMMYRATPIPSLGASPAEMALGRKIRTFTPMLSRNLKPKTLDHEMLKAKDEQAKSTQKFNYDRHHGAAALKDLQSGDKVFVKLDNDKSGWSQQAQVLNKYNQAPRSYVLQTPRGQIRRNRKHLRLAPSEDEESTPLPYSSQSGDEDSLRGYVPVSRQMATPSSGWESTPRSPQPTAPTPMTHHPLVAHAPMTHPSPIATAPMTRPSPTATASMARPSPTASASMTQPSSTASVPTSHLYNSAPVDEGQYRTRSGRCVRVPSRFKDS